MRKSKRLVTVTAGRLVGCLIYSQGLAADSPRARAEKAKCRSAARKKLNFKNSYEKLQLLLAANFSRNDLYLTLTYDDEHLPGSRSEARKRLARFFRGFAASRRAAGEVFKYIKCTHEMLDDGGRRLHHHLVINAGDEQRDYELIRSLWDQGDNIDIRPVCNTVYYECDDFLELARYLARERDPDAPLTAVGARSWSGSRNLRKPVRESVLVDEVLTVEAPPGAFVLDVDEKRNEFGSFKYIKYLLPERGPPLPRPARVARKIE
jgi:hypothetical protein